ncbi:MAG: nucleoside-diphosphate sugar epimerase/dehydratase, partial [Oligoflexus sp.]
MNRKVGQLLFPSLVLADLLAVITAWFLAFFFRFYTSIEVPQGIPPLVLYVKLVPFISGIWLLTAASTGFLRRTGRYKRWTSECLDVIPTSIVAVLGLIAFTYFYEEYRYSRLTLIFFAILQPMAILMARSSVRAFWRYNQRRKAPRRVLLIGRGDGIRQALEMSKHLGVERSLVLGVLLPGQDDKQADIQYCRRQSLALISEQKDWAQFFVEHPTHSVIIALPHAYYEFIEAELERIADQMPVDAPGVRVSA